MAGILEHPKARELLQAATLSPEEVGGCARRLQPFLQRYSPLFLRSEQSANAAIVLRGKLSGLQRKTSEPIANDAGVHRRAIRGFVGNGAWDDYALLAELRRHVRAEWGDRHAVLVIDPSSFPEKGVESCGVERQWCGRLGEIDNCQVGTFLFYACRRGHAPLDHQLWPPRGWAADAGRRAKTHVPEGIAYQERWEAALEMIDRAEEIPHAWVAADAEFGRVEAFRSRLRGRGESYLLDVPSETRIRDLEQEVEQPERRRGCEKKAPWENVTAWAARQPASRWERFEVRAGEKGPPVVEAMTVRVQTGGCAEERLVVTRSAQGEPEFHYRLSNAKAGVGLRELVRAGSERHRAEQVLQEGKGEVGLGQYEVRSWVGWHHHMTLSFLALWFLALEGGRVGGGKDAVDGVAAEAGVLAAATDAGPQRGTHRPGDQPRVAA